jgi:uncharacterized membrane protein YoaT (DUF817 family)
MAGALREFWWFGIKQAYACMFGGWLLFWFLLTKWYYPFESLARYDFLFLMAVGFQVLLLCMRWESRNEFLVILVFHLVATGMELFKTSDSIGSWVYPENSYFRIGNVPLFTGFMYSAVGSYIARVWRIFQMRFEPAPPAWELLILGGAIYANFILHHFLWDIRYLLLFANIWLFRRTWVYFRCDRIVYRMPILLSQFLASFFVWLAENAGTIAGVWLYPHQHQQWRWVGPEKWVSWFLLMLLSFALIVAMKEISGAEKKIDSQQ